MITSIVPQLIHMSTLFRNIGDVLELPEITVMGDDILALSVLSEDEILQKISSELSSKTLTVTGARAPVVFKKNYDYGELWSKILDDYREGKIRTIVDFVKQKKSIERAHKTTEATYIAPIDSYCGSKRNVAYWKGLLKNSPSKAVKDFLAYVQEVSCGVGEEQ